MSILHQFRTFGSPAGAPARAPWTAGPSPASKLDRQSNSMRAHSASGNRLVACFCGGRGALAANCSSVAINGFPIVRRNRVGPMSSPWHFEQKRPATGVKACSLQLNSIPPHRLHFKGTTRASRCGNEFCAISVRTMAGSNLKPSISTAEKVSSGLAISPSALYACT